MCFSFYLFPKNIGLIKIKTIVVSIFPQVWTYLFLSNLVENPVKHLCIQCFIGCCMPIYIPFHWLVVGTSPALLAHTIAKRRRLEVWKGEAKKDQEEGWRNSFGVSLLPYPGSVYLIKDVSAWLNWAVTCLLLFLLQWGLRKRNKHTWQYLPCNPAVSYLENAL